MLVSFMIAPLKENWFPEELVSIKRKYPSKETGSSTYWPQDEP
jgi:hypothetical protein